jgi:hypothetical protein
MQRPSSDFGTGAGKIICPNRKKDGYQIWDNVLKHCYVNQGRAPPRAAAFFHSEMALASQQQRVFDLTGAAAFLNIPFGDFAQFVRAGFDLPDCTDRHDLCEVRFSRSALELWRLEHSFGDART